MRRLFYIAVGAGIGVAAVRKLSKAASKLTPSGMADSLTATVGGLGASLRGFVVDVRIGMAEREAELHEALRGDDDTKRER
jgi:hypothetical protein